MRADSELNPWPRMQEETTRDITRQHILIQERWEAVWGATVQGGARSSLGHTLCRQRCSRDVLRGRTRGTTARGASSGAWQK